MAVEKLSQAQQRHLLDFLAEKLRTSGLATAQAEDAFAGIIGAFEGRKDATGRKAEEILGPS